MRGSQVLREAVGVLYIEQWGKQTSQGGRKRGAIKQVRRQQMRGKQTSQAAANAGQPATVGRGQEGTGQRALLRQALPGILPSQLAGGSGH